MKSEVAGVTRAVPEPFEKAVSLIRRLLAGQGLNVVEQLDMSMEPLDRLGLGTRPCVILLVDSPVLLFEAIALDRAAAVFVPLHVVLSGGEGTSYVHWVNPVPESGLRPPAPARAALEELYLRVTAALSELPLAADVQSVQPDRPAVRKGEGDVQ
jgi:uncharacterized protein (DUF302 family)